MQFLSEFGRMLEPTAYHYRLLESVTRFAIVTEMESVTRFAIVTDMESVTRFAIVTEMESVTRFAIVTDMESVTRFVRALGKMFRQHFVNLIEGHLIVLLNHRRYI